MNNKMKKRTITGVAIISGAILFSVGVAGTVHLINENNAIEAKTYVTAKENNFNAATTSAEINGISYSFDESDKSATVNLINEPPSGSNVIGSAGVMNGSYNTVYVNIPQSVSYNDTSYTIRYIGTTNSSIFSSSFKSYYEGLKATNVIVILPKTVYSVAIDVFTTPSYINSVKVINVSNDISFANQHDSKLIIYGVPGSGSENGVDSPWSNFKNIYSYEANETNKTAKIKGFSTEVLALFNILPSGVTVNFEIPSFIGNGTAKYISTSIANNAFANKGFMKTLIIPGTVDSIETGAFAGCPNINWVKFLGKNTEIDTHAFMQSNGIKEIYVLSGSKPEEFYNTNKGVNDTGMLKATKQMLSLSSIDEIGQQPFKISYTVGENLDTTGLVLKTTIVDSEGNNPLTSYVASGFSCSPTTLSTAGTQTITVTYEGKTTTFNVDVKDTTPAPAPDPSTEEYEVKLYDSDKATVLSTLTLKDGYFYQDGNKIEKNGKFNLPTKDGYKFVSYRSYGGDNQWILSDGTFGSEEQYNAVYNCIKNDYGTCSVYMYAEWEKIYDQLELEVYYDNTSGKKETIVLKDGAYYQGENRIEKDGKIKIPTKEGHKFLGYWGQDNDEHQWVNADGSFVGGEAQYDALWNYIKSYPDLAYMVARWAPITHTVHYDANGGDWRR